MSILKKLSDEIATCIKYANNDENMVKSIRTSGFVRSPFFDSIPDKIRESIATNHGGLTDTFSWKKHDAAKGKNYNITLHFNHSGTNLKKLKNPQEVKEHYVLVRTIIEFLSKFCNSDLKTHNIAIYMYLTKHEKRKPSRKIVKGGMSDDGETISQIHVNTGLTSFCTEDTEINIFRAEEWFKVFIHESIHNLCLDFGGLGVQEIIDDMRATFKVDSKYLLFETYTETWAEIIQVLFMHNVSISNKPFDIVSGIKDEFVFAVVQSDKIMKLCTKDQTAQYRDVATGNMSVLGKYKEDTNCFAYYVLKMIALYKMNEFLDWCLKNNGMSNIICFNKKGGSVKSFMSFFVKYYRDENMLKNIDKIMKMHKQSATPYIEQKLRISVLELMVGGGGGGGGGGGKPEHKYTTKNRKNIRKTKRKSISK
jgi:hypothetical protein